jgi:hypothetical protein
MASPRSVLKRRRPRLHTANDGASDMTTEALSTPAIRAIGDAEIDQVNGGWIPFIALGIALGIGYCELDGTFDKPRVLGDFPSGPKNVG